MNIKVKDLTAAQDKLAEKKAQVKAERDEQDAAFAEEEAKYAAEAEEMSRKAEKEAADKAKEEEKAAIEALRG